MDDNLSEQEPEVALRESLVAVEQQRAKRRLEALQRGICEEMRRWLVERDDLRDLRRQLVLLRLELTQARQDDVGRLSVHFERVLPSGDAPVDVSELIRHGPSLLIGFAAQQPGFVDDIADQLTTAVEAEEVIGQMLKHSAIKLGHRKAMTAARILAGLQERATVVIAVSVLAVGVLLS